MKIKSLEGGISQVLLGDYAVLVNDVHLHFLSEGKWSIIGRGDKVYLMRSMSCQEGKSRWVGLHRLIMNAQKGQLVDHANGNSLDNRCENLRVATPTENSINRKNGAIGQSGYYGVWIDDARRKKQFRVVLSIGGKRKHMGRWTTALEAARAHDELAIKHYGVFAVTNLELGLLEE